MGEKENIHAGHRKRLKESMRESNFNLSEINLLEALLFYSIPRGDTNEIAHNLLESFGSFRAIFEADIDDLKAVKGMGEHYAFLIKLVANINKRAAVDKRNGKIFNNTGVAVKYLRPLFINEKDEVVLVMLLDNSRRLISVKELSRGRVNRANVDSRKLIEIAVRTNAAAIILAHNHPHGICQPSEEDLIMTSRLKTLLNEIGISLLDHLIFSNDEYTALRERKDFRLYLNAK